MKAKRITQQEAAKEYGKTVQAISKQLKRHGLRADKAGKYDAEKVADAMKAGALLDKNKFAEQLASGAFPKGSLHEQRLVEQVRKLTAEADTAEFKLEQMRNEVISIADHRDRIQAIVNTCKRTIQIWVNTTAAEIGTPEIKQKLEQAQRKAFAAAEAEYDEQANG
jgi:hypothetical protein